MSKKLLIAAVVAVMALGTIAQATDSRVEVLAPTAGDTYLMDDINIFSNPATAARYSKSVFVHMGNDAADMYAYGGVLLGLGDMLTIGGIIGRNPDNELGLAGGALNEILDPAITTGFNNSAQGQFRNNFGAFPALTPAGMNADAMDWHNPLELMLAAKLGSLNLGIGWYYAKGKAMEEVTNDAASGLPVDENETEATASLHNLKIGLTADMGNMTPELVFHYNPYKINTSYTEDWNGGVATNTEWEREAKGRSIVIGGRVFIKMGDSLTLVPALAYSSGKAEATVTNDPSLIIAGVGINEEDISEEYKGSRITTGLGINYTTDRLLVASSLSLGWEKGTQTLEIDGIEGELENEGRMLALPIVNIGMEYQATKILVVRSGIGSTTLYSKMGETISDTVGDVGVAGPDNETDRSITTQTTAANAGLGLHFGNLVVDLTVGGEVLAGESTGSWFSAADFNYKF